MTPEEFLEHHGVKGMQWGVRKSENRSGVGDRAKKFYGRNKHAIKEGVAFTAVVVGAAVAGHYLAKAAGMKLSQVKASNIQTNFSGMDRLLKSNAQMTQSGMRRSRMSAEAMKSARRLADFDKFHKEIVSKANADLLAGYQRNFTPHPLREFI
jgi:phage-related protein